MTSQDVGWVGFPEGEALSVLPVGAVSGLSEFAFEVDVPPGVFRLLQQAVFSSEEVILWAFLRGCGR